MSSVRGSGSRRVSLAHPEVEQRCPLADHSASILVQKGGGSTIINIKPAAPHAILFISKPDSRAFPGTRRLRRIMLPQDLTMFMHVQDFCFSRV